MSNIQHKDTKKIQNNDNVVFVQISTIREVSYFLIQYQNSQ